jgi:hypothetical protein
MNQNISTQKGKHRHVSQNTITVSRISDDRKQVIPLLPTREPKITEKKSWLSRVRDFGNEIKAKIFKR